jgi:hypothetical protein
VESRIRYVVFKISLFSEGKSGFHKLKADAVQLVPCLHLLQGICPRFENAGLEVGLRGRMMIA